MLRNILVPLDQSAVAEQAVGAAVTIARASGGEIGLILAREQRPYAGVLAEDVDDRAGWAAGSYLRSLADEVSAKSGVPTTAAVEHGAPVDVIRHRASLLGSGLIVMTSHGHGGSNGVLPAPSLQALLVQRRSSHRRSAAHHAHVAPAYLGRVSEAVVHESGVPVLMLRADEHRDWRASDPYPFGRILVPVDGSAQSEAILEATMQLAQCGGAVVVLLRVVTQVPLYIDDPALPSYPSATPDERSTTQLVAEARLELAELARRVARARGLRVETHVVVQEHVAQSILDVAEETQAGLIAMTAHGNGTSRLVVGNVTDKVLRAARVPILLLGTACIPGSVE
jgi:nucleotide-binding universal stress UspA family protein